MSTKSSPSPLSPSSPSSPSFIHILSHFLPNLTASGLACSCMPGAGVGTATWVMVKRLTGNTCYLFCLANQKGEIQAALQMCCVETPKVYLTFFLSVLSPCLVMAIPKYYSYCNLSPFLSEIHSEYWVGLGGGGGGVGGEGAGWGNSDTGPFTCTRWSSLAR